ncbi:MAG: polymer-forming cytoskeletal protein, partial [Janthinobacterium sp.]
MRLLHIFAALTLLLGASLAHAATLNFNGGAVNGCSLPASSTQYTCTSLALGSTDVIIIGSAYAVTVNSSLAMSYNQGLTMSGDATLTVKGNLDIKDINPPNLKVTGGNLTAEGGTFLMGSQEQTVTANISATTIKMGSNNVTVTGKISAKGPVEIASGSVINGPISGTVVNILPASTRIQGDITATTSLTIGSGSQVTGNLKSPTIDLKASGLLVTGDVDASNSLSIASGNGIKGNVDAGEVTLDSSNAYITGNAKVDHITLGWQGRVQQTITCKAYTPSNPCSCVTNNSGWAFNEPMGPKCGPGTPSGLHHFQIEHPLTALTCQVPTVTVT